MVGELLDLCGSIESVLARDPFPDLIQDDSLFHVDAFYHLIYLRIHLPCSSIESALHIYLY